jgi:ABC-type nitrate/sulfonate/bicarbonate transport system substrate-binding protein
MAEWQARNREACMQRYGLLLGLAAIAMAFAAPAAAQQKLTVITFSGATNLPVWIAVDKGFFKKEGLDVQHEVTRGSKQVMEGLMTGKYQFGSAALDNTIAYTEGQGDVKIDNFDLVAILGVHSGMSRIVSRPEIKDWKDLKGKTVAVDAANSGYGLVMYKLLAMNGLQKDKDYKVLAVGSGKERMQAMKDGRAYAAAVSPPEDTYAKKEGFNVLADATEVLGAYQGSAYIVSRKWAKEHEKEVLAFIRAIVASSDFVFTHKAEAMAVMKAHIKGVSDEEAETIYAALTGNNGGLNKGAKINDAGVKMLLDLRNEFSGSDQKLTDTKKYADTTYYDKATKK